MNKLWLIGFLLLLIGCSAPQTKEVSIRRADGTAVEITAEQAEQMVNIFSRQRPIKSLPNCSSDYQIFIGEAKYSFHSECGSVTLAQKFRSFVLEGGDYADVLAICKRFS